MDDLTEEELRQIVSGPSNDWMSALKKQHPDWIMQAIGGGNGNQETGELGGPIEGYTFYDPKKTEAGKDKFKRYDASGKLIGEQQFKKPGNIWDLTKQATADLGPILQFTPLAPFVRAISALSAAEQGNVLGALASGLPLADKIPGLDKATAAALQSAGKYAAVASAAKSKDPMQLLNALSQTKEFGGQVPQELKTAGEYASKAGALQRATKGDIGALLGLAQGATAPSKSYFPGYESTEEIPEGFFAPGGEGYMEPEAGDADSYIQSIIGSEDALPKDVTEFLPASEVIRERTSLEDRYPAPEGQTGYDTTPKTTMSPNDMAKFLEANIDDPGTIETLMQDYYPELYRQQIGITGKREEPEFTPGRSIRDIGDVTQIQPGEKLEGTDIPEPDLSVGLPTVPGTAPKPPGKPPTPPTQPTKPATPLTGFDPRMLLALFGNQQRPEEEPYRVAQTVASPFGTIYDTYGGNDMQDLMSFLKRG